MLNQPRPPDTGGFAAAARALPAEALAARSPASPPPAASADHPRPEPPASAQPDASSDAAALADVRATESMFAAAARQAWASLPHADVEAAVEGGMLTTAATSSPLPHTVDGGDEQAPGPTVARLTGNAAATTSRAAPPPHWPHPADWSAFGQVIPVLAGSPGAGASVVTAVLSDALQLADRSVLMVDVADPARSGLAMAARSQGSAVAAAHPGVRIRMSWRAQAVLAGLQTPLPVIAPSMVPPPRFWRPAGRHVDVTVVDIGTDPWRTGAHPLSGAGMWLRHGNPAPRPLLVVRATRPSLQLAEQVLARFTPWITPGIIAPPARLVVVGAKNWPDGVVGTAGLRVATLVDEAVFLPHDHDVEVAGVTPEVTSPRLRKAVTALLRDWDLVPGRGKAART